MFGLDVQCEMRTGLSVVDMIYDDMLLENNESVIKDNEVVEKKTKEENEVKLSE